MKTLDYLSPLGALVLIIAFILTYFAFWTAALIVFIAVGVIDLVLYFGKRDTISQWIHALFPKWIDVVIMIGLLIFTWIVLGPPAFLTVLMGYSYNLYIKIYKLYVHLGIRQLYDKQDVLGNYPIEFLQILLNLDNN